MPGESNFSPGLGTKADSWRIIVDSAVGIGRSSTAMAQNTPYLPLPPPTSPFLPRDFGGKQAERLKK